MKITSDSSWSDINKNEFITFFVGFVCGMAVLYVFAFIMVNFVGIGL